MECNTEKTGRNERALPTSGGAEIKKDRDSGEMTYWGILCRTCGKLVAFDFSPYVSFGPGAASMMPGAVLCGDGHNHIYFPRDFHFLSSSVPTSEATMRGNRETYRAINTRSQPPSGDSRGERPNLKPEDESLVHSEADAARLLSDARKEAQAAAKNRWKDWAAKKVV